MDLKNIRYIRIPTESEMVEKHGNDWRIKYCFLTFIHHMDYLLGNVLTPKDILEYDNMYKTLIVKDKNYNNTHVIYHIPIQLVEIIINPEYKPRILIY